MLLEDFCTIVRVCVADSTAGFCVFVAFIGFRDAFWLVDIAARFTGVCDEVDWFIVALDTVVRAGTVLGDVLLTTVRVFVGCGTLR